MSAIDSTQRRRGGSFRDDALVVFALAAAMVGRGVWWGRGVAGCCEVGSFFPANYLSKKMRGLDKYREKPKFAIANLGPDLEGDTKMRGCATV